MATQLCQKCKQAHPGRVCDYDQNGNCAETVDANEDAETSTKESKDKNDIPAARRSR
jgi:hypothetical protein